MHGGHVISIALQAQKEITSRLAEEMRQWCNLGCHPRLRQAAIACVHGCIQIPTCTILLNSIDGLAVFKAANEANNPIAPAWGTMLLDLVLSWYGRKMMQRSAAVMLKSQATGLIMLHFLKIDAIQYCPCTFMM